MHVLPGDHSTTVFCILPEDQAYVIYSLSTSVLLPPSLSLTLSLSYSTSLSHPLHFSTSNELELREEASSPLPIVMVTAYKCAGLEQGAM